MGGWNESLTEAVGGWVNFCCGVPTIGVNLLVLCIAFRHIDLSSKLNQIFVVSMTIADLLFGMAYMLTQKFVSQIPLILCAPYYITVWACQIGSVLFLLFLNVDKFISLYCPLHYHALVTQRRVVVQTLVAWLLIFSVALFTYFGPWTVSSAICDGVRLHPLYYAIYTFICYIFPVLISISISIYIFRLAQTAGKSETSLPQRRKRRKQLLTRILFVFSSTVWTTFTTLPYRIALASYQFCIWSQDNSTLAKYGDEADACASGSVNVFIYVLMFALPLSALGNPIITICTQRVYRLRVLRMLASVLTALKVPDSLHPDIPSGRHIYDEEDTRLDDSSRLRDASLLKNEATSSTRLFQVA